MNRSIDTKDGLSLAVRQRKLRRTRRGRVLQDIGHNTVWMIVLIGMAVFVAAELIGATSRF